MRRVELYALKNDVF